MAALFAIYFFSLLLLIWNQRNTVFILILINLALCLMMLLYHTTDIRLW